MADFAVLSHDYFTVPDEQVRGIGSVPTVVIGRIVHAAAPYGDFAPPPPLESELVSCWPSATRFRAARNAADRGLYMWVVTTGKVEIVCG